MSDNPNRYPNQYDSKNQAPAQAFPFINRYQPETNSSIFIPEMNQQFPSGMQPNFVPSSQQNPSNLPKNYDEELDDVFGPDEGHDPFIERAAEVKKKADQFLQIIKTQFPNRYFISKRITQNPEVWEICLQKSYVVINDENYIRKLQNCFDVIVFPFNNIIV